MCSPQATWDIPMLVSSNMPPKNLHNHAYFEEDPTDAPHKDVETDFETGEFSKPETPNRQKKVTTSDNPEDDLVTVSHDSTPSPTASDIVLKLNYNDFVVASNLHRKWQESGLNEHEGKAKMKEVQKIFDNEREVRERKEEEEMKKEYGEDGKDSEGKGKEV
jgi:hypothetical protein